MSIRTSEKRAKYCVPVIGAALTEAYKKLPVTSFWGRALLAVLRLTGSNLYSITKYDYISHDINELETVIEYTFIRKSDECVISIEIDVKKIINSDLKLKSDQLLHIMRC